MAASGNIDCYVSSVDYGGGRGSVRMVEHMTWTLSDSNVLTIRHGSSESLAGNASSWGICGTTSGYGIRGIVQFSSDGGASWQELTSGYQEVAICSNLTNVYNTMQTVVNQFQPVQLSVPGLVRVTYGGTRQPAPSASLPNAFPSYVTSEADQVPINIPVETDYVPGQVFNGSVWVSHNRSGGKAQIFDGGTWKDMRTKEGQGDAPEIYDGASWKNMRKMD